ncbi:YopX family protein [Lacticaseibacillus rhamnosus]|uniref:YopX family protein n=1 Tax=Lacticaseibacillus rhamnosus TaxID=47715 RepID=UPI0028165E1D|nr:YopX family protein [Lacticaseibacillus rhamnosus]
MKREIKFRAWNKENECYLYDIQRAYDMLSGCVKYDDGEDAVYEEECFAGFLDNEQYIIEQYTGLHDKNGREIYEGDIVRSGKDNIGDPEPMIGQVIMREGSWLIENEKMQEEIGLFSEITSREVIGNIFEDNQLLEGK